MCIYDGYNFLIVEYVGHDWAIITRKHGSNFPPSKTSDCRIMVVGIFLVVVGLFWLVVGGGGLISGAGGWWWVFFGWWWVVVGRDGWWWVVARFIIALLSKLN